ncbi:hypothetical protein JNE120442_41560 [Escherichia coli]|nr:hypothetical protein Eco16F5M1D1_2079 [Escherichia coli O8:H8]BDW59870.1 hypothetical protein JNE120442_23150 [Escherichia coli]BDW61711.1 hypothetical protein JNE120442_41560 [Escherichia coli]
MSENIISSITIDLSLKNNVNMRVENIPKDKSGLTFAPRSKQTVRIDSVWAM